MSNRFHNKFHRHNHHTNPTDGPLYPDSGYDPIASQESPFQGEFYSVDQITTANNLSALGNLYAQDGKFYGDVDVDNRLDVVGQTVLGDSVWVSGNLLVGSDSEFQANVQINQNLTVVGNITAYGDFSYLETIVSLTSALSVVNVGTGPALTVSQAGAQPVAKFLDAEGGTVIISDLGYVGINTENPTERLTVYGNISGAQEKVALGVNTTASGVYSLAQNYGTTASGTASHAEGTNTEASGEASHAEGQYSEAKGTASHAAGLYATAAQNYTYAWSDGNLSTATTNVSTTRTGQYMVSASGGVFIPGNVGIGTDNNTNALTVNGVLSANGNVIGTGNLYLSGNLSNQGTAYFNNNTSINGVLSANGNLVSTGNAYLSGNLSNQGTAYFNNNTSINGVISGNNLRTSFNQGSATGNYSFAEGFGRAFGEYSHAEGYQTTASGVRSHAEGYDTTASGTASHAEGYETTASEGSSHAEGYATTASGFYSHAEGQLTTASGVASHAEGYQTTASGDASHAEGIETQALGLGSHAQGVSSIAAGDYSHAAGSNTYALGSRSYTTGANTSALKVTSYAHGRWAVANHSRAWVWQGTGTENILFSSTRTDQFAIRPEGGFYIAGNVGIGTDDNTNALTVNGVLSANGNVIGTGNLYLSGNSNLGSANTNSTIIRGITKIADSSATNGILFGSGNANYDVNLYRVSSNVLATDDNLFVGGKITAVDGLSSGNDINIYNTKKLQLGYSPAPGYNDGGEIWMDYPVSGDGGELIIGTRDNGDEPIVFRQSKNDGPPSWNLEPLIIGSDNRTGVGAPSGTRTFPAQLTVYGALSTSGNLITTNVSANNITLLHTTPNDGINPNLFIGEMGDGTGGTTLGVLSGFTVNYNEIVNKFNISTTGFATAPLTGLVIDSNANVGIGTNNPVTKLSVIGTVSATNFVSTNGFTPVTFFANVNMFGALNSVYPTNFTVPAGYKLALVSSGPTAFFESAPVGSPAGGTFPTLRLIKNSSSGTMSNDFFGDTVPTIAAGECTIRGVGSPTAVRKAADAGENPHIIIAANASLITGYTQLTAKVFFTGILIPV